MAAASVTEVFAGLVALIVALSGAFTVWNGRKIHHELRTMNGLPVGAASDATETRRVARIPWAKRTPSEQAHLDASPALEAPQGGRLERVEAISTETRDNVEAINRAVNAKPRDQPPLYDIVATLDLKVDELITHVGRLERSIGGGEPVLPAEPDV